MVRLHGFLLKVSKPKFFFRIFHSRLFFLYIFLLWHPFGYSYFVRLFSLCKWPLYSYFVQPYSYFAHRSQLTKIRFIYISCTILELSGTIPESADKVGFLLCAGTIPESYRFLLCAEHIYVCFNSGSKCLFPLYLVNTTIRRLLTIYWKTKTK